jgi:AcrR family transcriptional regulator
MRTNSSKPRIPKQQRSIQTKRQIIEAAMKLFSQKGYHGTNSKEIAREAGVATGCFYAYFSDKKAVFIAALEIYFDQFNTITQTHIAKLTLEKANTKQFLREMIQSFIEAHDVFTNLNGELTAMYYTDPDIQKMIAEFDKTNIRNIMEYLENIRANLRVSNLEAAVEVVYYSFHSIVDRIVFSKKKNAAILGDELADMVEMYLFGDNFNDELLAHRE